MKMYYITRYEHNPDRPTLYYYGAGRWFPMTSGDPRKNRLSLRLYQNEVIAQELVKCITEGDWHEIEINT